jgi:predicted GIY-YIG superfamily endonuclease
MLNVEGQFRTNQIQPRKQPGLYMIRCTQNDWRYYGESQNVSGRLAHRSLLNRQIHSNYLLQDDYNKYGIDFFLNILYFHGTKVEQSIIRREKSLKLFKIETFVTICENCAGEATLWEEFTP